MMTPTTIPPAALYAAQRVVPRRHHGQLLDAYRAWNRLVREHVKEDESPCQCHQGTAIGTSESSYPTTSRTRCWRRVSHTPTTPSAGACGSSAHSSRDARTQSNNCPPVVVGRLTIPVVCHPIDPTECNVCGSEEITYVTHEPTGELLAWCGPCFCRTLDDVPSCGSMLDCVAGLCLVGLAAVYGVVPWLA